MRKIILLIKKDIYLNYKSILPFGCLVLIFFSYKIIAINNMFNVTETLILIFPMGLASSYFIPLILFDTENKNEGLKVLKFLGFGNKEIYFSKLIFIYLFITICFILPLIWLLIVARSFVDITILNSLELLSTFVFVFFILSGFFVFFFSCFNKIFFNLLLNIFFLFLVILAIKFKDNLAVMNYDLTNILKVIFFLQPIILFFVIFFGYKLFDKVYFYKKLK